MQHVYGLHARCAPVCTRNVRLYADFVSLERKLIKGLNAAIQLEGEGAKESEVRNTVAGLLTPLH